MKNFTPKYTKKEIIQGFKTLTTTCKTENKKAEYRYEKEWVEYEYAKHDFEEKNDKTRIVIYPFDKIIKFDK